MLLLATSRVRADGMDLVRVVLQWEVLRWEALQPKVKVAMAFNGELNETRAREGKEKAQPRKPCRAPSAYSFCAAWKKVSFEKQGW